MRTSELLDLGEILALRCGGPLPTGLVIPDPAEVRRDERNIADIHFPVPVHVATRIRRTEGLGHDCIIADRDLVISIEVSVSQGEIDAGNPRSRERNG